MADFAAKSHNLYRTTLHALYIPSQSRTDLTCGTVWNGVYYCKHAQSLYIIFCVFCKGLLDLCCLKSTSSQKLQSDIEGLLSSDSLSQCSRPLRFSCIAVTSKGSKIFLSAQSLRFARKHKHLICPTHKFPASYR